MRKDLATRVSMAAALATIARTGWKPATVFDVGVGLGTDGLYDAFPEARLVLVEPVAEAKPFLDDIAKRYPGTVCEVVAAGSSSGTAEIAVVPGITGSSLHRGNSNGVDMRLVPTDTLDAIAARHALRPPYLIKLDVEGHELEVLEGAAALLPDTDVVVSEVASWDTGHRPTVVDIINVMHGHGLVLHDVANLGYRGIDDAMMLLDLVFVRETSVIRRVKSAKTPEQAAAAREYEAAKLKRASERIAALQENCGVRQFGW